MVKKYAPKPGYNRYTLELSDDAVGFFRRLGDGVLTHGIHIAARQLSTGTALPLPPRSSHQQTSKQQPAAKAPARPVGRPAVDKDSLHCFQYNTAVEWQTNPSRCQARLLDYKERLLKYYGFSHEEAVDPDRTLYDRIQDEIASGVRPPPAPPEEDEPDQANEVQEQAQPQSFDQWEQE